MSRHWIRRPPRWKETLGAGLLATGVAAVSFYLTRMLLAREPLPEPSPKEEESRTRKETPGERRA